MANEEVILSICIPTYNRGERLEKTIREILTYPGNDIEVVVIDDASTDDSVVILKKIKDPRLRIIENEKNLGQNLNQAKAIFSGHGKYTVALMDRDYIIQKNLGTVIKKLRDHHTPILLAGEHKEIWNSHSRKYIYMSCYITHPSNVIIHTKSLKKTVSFQQIKRDIAYDTTPFVYFPPVAGLYLLLKYGLYSTLDVEMTRAMTKGTVSGDCVRAGKKSTDYYLLEGAVKRLKLYDSIIMRSNKKAMRIFPWIYAAELHNATLWNLEMYNEGNNRIRSGIVRYRDMEYLKNNQEMMCQGMKLVKNKSSKFIYYKMAILIITYLNQCKIEKIIFNRNRLEGKIAERIWKKIFYSI